MNSPDISRSGKLAADKDRDLALDMLARAVAEGRLTMEEYEGRITRALTARTFADIDAVIADLPAEGTAPAPAAPVPVQGIPVPAIPDEAVVAFFGNETRKGHWTVPAHFTAKSAFGDCHIELQQARLQSRVTTIDAVARFGSVSIQAPDGFDVRLTGRAIFGSKNVKARRRVRPGSPVLLVRCDVLFGSVTVRRKR